MKPNLPPAVTLLALATLATASGSTRYLFAIPKFRNDGAFEKDCLPAEDVALTLEGSKLQATAAQLLEDGTQLDFKTSADGRIFVKLPGIKRTELIDVVEIELAPAAAKGGT